MKKLFLFILVLFGILSTQSLAWNYGCGENIPPDVCGAGSGGGFTQPSIGLPSPVNFGALAINPYTGSISYITAQKDNKKAAQIVMSDCGQNCQLIFEIKANQCAAVVHSTNLDHYVHYIEKPFDLLSNTNMKRTKEKSSEKAIKKCKKEGGQNCKVLIAICANGS